MWNTFVKRRLIPTSHNSTVDRKRLVLIQSIINKRTINVGEIILREIHECGKKDRGPMYFPCLITGLCVSAGVPIEETDEYTPPRRGWTRDVCHKVMQITQAESVQATPQQFTADTAAGAQYTADMPGTAHTSAAADPYQEILQRMAAMDLRQQRYMEYQRDFNGTLAQMMLHAFPDQGVQFPEFPSNMFVTAAPYTETTPAPGGPRPFFHPDPQPITRLPAHLGRQILPRPHLSAKGHPSEGPSSALHPDRQLSWAVYPPR